MIDEFEILEAHGVESEISGYFVDARERNDHVVVALKGLELRLTPDGALRLAAMLRRLARRVKARNQA